MSNRDYIIIHGILRGRTEKAICIATRDKTTWVAKSVIFGPDEIKIRDKPIFSEISIGIMKWKARGL